MSNIQQANPSSKFYPKKAHFESKSQIAPNSLIFNRNLSEPAKIFLLALNGIISCTQNWVPIQSDIQKRLGWGQDRMENAIASCVKHGFLKVKQQRTEKGKFAPNDFEFCLEGSFINCINNHQSEECPHTPFSTVGGFPVTVHPSTDNPYIPIPSSVPKRDIYIGNAPTPKKQKAMDKDVPLFHPKKELGLSKQRKFPRKPEHQACFEWLMSLNLTDENGYLNEDNMSFLSHKHPRRKLENAYSHLLHKVGLGKFKPRSLIASFTHILNNEHSPVGFNSQANLQYAKDYQEVAGWRSLEIHEKYVEDLNFPGQDISLNMNPEEFQRTLDKLFESIQRR
jgi:hypothetical protein